MSDNSLAMRLAGRSGIGTQLPDVEESSCDDLGSFGYLRGVRERAVMLELRKRNGNTLAIGYAWIERMELDRSAGIILHVAGQPIVIEGRNLNGPTTSRAKLFEGLVWHRVPWIQELPVTETLGRGDGICVVESIGW